MKTFKTGALAALCAGTVMLMTAMPAGADNAGVNMIYPPKRASDFDKTDEKTAETNQATQVEVINVTPSLPPFYIWYKRHRVNCALFQNYPSSRKACGGRLYPF